jgi:hypothetical protein
MLSVLVGAGIGLLLAIHGFAHWQLTTLWGSRPEASSWLLGSAAAGLGNALWVLALLAFLAAGVGAGFHLAWWRTAAVAAAAVSLVLMALFWDPRLWMGAATNVGLLVGLLWLRLPSTELLGA